MLSGLVPFLFPPSPILNHFIQPAYNTFCNEEKPTKKWTCLDLTKQNLIDIVALKNATMMHFSRKYTFSYAKQFHSYFVSIIKSLSSFVSSLADVPPGWRYWMQKHGLQCIILLTGVGGIRFVQDSR